ncbi:MAG TPA: hypothetical protein VH109_08080 [Steroidobacteraceae bacterium]|jgi:hypothetical protein|nr:hypothetical protein [Steroidobacteraceae bacterium]
MESGPFAVAIAFWIFCGVCAVAGIVGDYKKRQAALEPLRAAIEKGQQLDPAVVERLMSAERRGANPEGLMIAGVITLSAGVGVAVFAFLIDHVAAVAFYPVFGGGVIAFCVGAGLVIASRLVGRSAGRQGKPGPDV